MRSWDKYCEDTEKAFKHFIDCIDQPVYIRGYMGTKHSYLFQVNYLLHPYWDNWVTVEVLPHQAGFKLLLEYFMMTPEEQAKRHSDYAQLIASLISGHME